ncbi:methyl-accepting chemotaxis protein [Thalassotalea euphylliae]|uniref:Methyl-accepting chemotaxis protein n=1 Tax=Thalassotalea euphylliae TaxID=1655234 RepID=A0A3E0UH17_9GAMM|nr:methyl-accepting chemotaxis protein [Thalassotalea euphylliae]REL36298.1 methyl-accepting chemotaxis protein [Thalassotalea euphylliae]
MQKFKLHLIGSLGVIIVAIIALLVTLSYNTFKNESVSLNKAILKEQNATTESVLIERFSAYKDTISAITLAESDVLSNTLSANLTSQLATIENIQRDISDGIYLFRDNGDIYDTKGELQSFNVKQLNREYYRAIFEQGQDFYISAPFNSAVSGEQVLGMAHRINRSFAILSNIKLDAVLGSLANAKNMFMYTQQGTILVAPYPEFLGKNIFTERSLYQQFNQQNPILSYTANVAGDNIDFTAFWTELEVNNWSFVSFVKDSAISEKADSQLIIDLIIGLVCLAIAVIVLQVLLQKLVLTPVGGAPAEIESLMAEMASGDFTQTLEQTGKETGIYLSLVNLSNQLSDLIRNSHAISENVASASQELNAVMGHTLNNAQQEMAQVEQISTAIHELSCTSNEVSDKAIIAEERANDAQANVATGKATLEENIILSSDIDASVAESAQLTQELQDFAVEIGSVTDVINSISEQTNLLALNAAIEAARAGEHGRGFAVVADEVRNLASKTQESTVSIQNLIEKLQSQSQKASQNMEQNVELIEKSVVLADKIKVAFEDISTAVESISEVNTLVATASQEQQSVTQDISRTTTQAFDLVQQNVSAVNQTLQASTELSQLSEAQKTELSHFKVQH